MPTVNINSTKICAFCRNWYDPANETIKPIHPSQGMWEFDFNAKKKCLKKNVDMNSTASCNQYQCKV